MKFTQNMKELIDKIEDTPAMTAVTPESFFSVLTKLEARFEIESDEARIRKRTNLISELAKLIDHLPESLFNSYPKLLTLFTEHFCKLQNTQFHADTLRDLFDKSGVNSEDDKLARSYHARQEFLRKIEDYSSDLDADIYRYIQTEIIDAKAYSKNKFGIKDAAWSPGGGQRMLGGFLTHAGWIENIETMPTTPTITSTRFRSPITVRCSIRRPAM